MKRQINIIFAVFLMTFLSACGGGGGGGGGGGAVVGPSYTANFTVVNETPSDGTVTLQKSSISGSIVYIDVVVTTISNVGGAAIKLDYDATKVNWAGSYQLGEVFSALGVKLTGVALDSGLEGRLVIGITGNEDVTVTGSKVLITIPFRVIETGESAISFSDDSGLTKSTAPGYEMILSYSISEWIGGTVSGV